MTNSNGNSTPFGRGAPFCAPPDPQLRSPHLKLPEGACDSHAHICGPASRFAYDSQRIYTPPDALVADYSALLDRLDVHRAVLVQPSVYGADNEAMLEAMEGMRAAGVECRAVAVVDPQIDDAELKRLDAAGVRGIRFNLVDVQEEGSGPSLERMRTLCERIAPLDWHSEFLIHVDDDPAFDETFGDWPVDIVIGHMGYCRIGATTDAPGFQAVLRLAEAHRCWIKLTGPYRIDAGDLPYPDAGEFARKLADTVPDRLVWGTDWPHVMVTKAMPNDADLCDLLADWLPDPALFPMILADNPAALYGFDALAKISGDKPQE